VKVKDACCQDNQAGQNIFYYLSPGNGLSPFIIE